MVLYYDHIITPKTIPITKDMLLEMLELKLFNFGRKTKPKSPIRPNRTKKTYASGDSQTFAKDRSVQRMAGCEKRLQGKQPKFKEQTLTLNGPQGNRADKDTAFTGKDFAIFVNL